MEASLPVATLALLAILALAFLGIMALGFYDRRRMFDILLESTQRNAMLAHSALSRGVPSMPPPPVTSMAERAGAASPSLADDETWKALNAQWESEAVELQADQDRRSAIITASIRAAQEQQAAVLRAQGKLSDESPEPIEKASQASSP